MALAKKKQDEKNLHLLKTLVSLSCNKQCFDCGQKGPTYVDLTIGSFICMSCSGIVRGLNPPHRVKSITMSSFTDDEIEFIKCRGNYFCKEVWLGNHSDNGRSIDVHNDQNKKDFLCIKYERRQWYVEPSPNLFSEAKQLTEAALQQIEQNSAVGKTHRSYSGSANIHLNHSNGSSTISTPRGASQMPMPDMFTPQAHAPVQNHVPTAVQTPVQQQISPRQQQPPPPQQQQQQPSQLVSLFDDDLETALRKQNIAVGVASHPNPVPAATPPQPPQAGASDATAFPVNFASSFQPTPFTKAAQLAGTTTTAPVASSVSPNNGNNGHKADSFADFDSAFGKDQQKSSAPPPVIMAPPPDRYKALEDLDDLLTLTGSTGVISSGIDWSSTGMSNTKPAVANAMQKKTQQSFQPQQASSIHGVPSSFPQQPFHTPAGFQQQHQQQPFSQQSVFSDPFNTSSAYAAVGAAPPPPYSAAPPYGHVPVAQQQQQVPQQFPAAFGQPAAAFSAQTFATHNSSAIAPPQFGAVTSGFGVLQQTPAFGQNSFASNPFIASQSAATLDHSLHNQQLPQQQQQQQQIRSFSNNPFL